VTVDLPRWPLADRLSLALASAAGPMVEVVLARHPGAPFGVGITLAAALVAGLWLQRRRRPRTLGFAPTGDWLRFAGEGRRAFRRGHGTRLLGLSVVVHWEVPGRSGALWLTPADLPRERLRALAVRLAASSPPVAR
jgi:uncharacterized protein (TIGR03382 family)